MDLLRRLRGNGRAHVRRGMVASLAVASVLVVCWIGLSALDDNLPWAATTVASGEPSTGSPDPWASLETPGTIDWAAIAKADSARSVTITVSTSGRDAKLRLAITITLTLKPLDPLIGPIVSGAGESIDDHGNGLVSSIIGDISLSTGSGSLDIDRLPPATFNQQGAAPGLVATIKEDGYCSDYFGADQCSGGVDGISIDAPTINDTAYAPANLTRSLVLNLQNTSIIGVRGASPSSMSAYNATVAVPDANPVYVDLNQDPYAPGSSPSATPTSEDPGAVTTPQTDETGFPAFAAILGITLVIAAAWVVGRRLAEQHSAHRTTLIISSAVVVSICVDLLMTLELFGGWQTHLVVDSVAAAWWGLVLPLLALNRLGQRSTAWHRPTWDMLLVCGASVVLIGISLTKLIPQSHGGLAVIVVVATLLSGLVPMLTALAMRRRDFALPTAIGGIAVLGGFSGLWFLEKTNHTGWWSIAVLSMLGVAWAPPIRAAASRFLGLRGLIVSVTVTIASLLLFEPVVGFTTGVVNDPDSLWNEQLNTFPIGPFLSFVATDALGSVAIIVAVLLLRSIGRTAAAQLDRRTVPLGVLVVAATVNPIISWFAASKTDVVAIAVSLCTLTLLVSTTPANEAANLDAVSDLEHTDALQQYARRQLLEGSRSDFYKAARTELAAGKLAVDDFDRRWEELTAGSAPSSSAPAPSADRSIRGAGGGVTPWRNAVAGAAIALTLSSPLIVYEFYGLHALLPDWALAQILSLLRHALRWVAYGFFYGFFYTRLPSTDPVRKALALAAAITPAELLILVDPHAEPTAHVGQALLLRCGEIVFFCVALGLLWERRLASAANLRWNMIRDFRRLGSLAAPVTTVTVAVATVVATSLASAATLALLHTQAPSTPSPSVPPTTSSPR